MIRFAMLFLLLNKKSKEKEKSNKGVQKERGIE
jgi:hypothetical protein